MNNKIKNYNPTLITHNFKITSKQNNEILGTGNFKTIKEISKQEQLDFFHQFTNGFYLNKEQIINIIITKCNEK